MFISIGLIVGLAYLFKDKVTVYGKCGVQTCALFHVCGGSGFLPECQLNPSLWAINILNDLKQDGFIDVFPKDKLVEVSSNLELMPFNEHNEKHFSGIGKFHGNMTCTAFFVATRAEFNNLQGPAYAITPGHCVSFDTNKTYVNEDAGRVLLGFTKLVFNYFATEKYQPRVDVTKVMYSSVNTTDIAILELDVPYGELMIMDISPISLAAEELYVDQNINLIGIPNDNIAVEKAYLSNLNCKILDTSVRLKEANWIFEDYYKTDCSDVYGGMSGSILSVGNSRIAAGMLTTGNFISQGTNTSKNCEIDAPCEISGNKTTLSPNTGYAVNLNMISACFNELGIFDLNLRGCPLKP